MLILTGLRVRFIVSEAYATHFPGLNPDRGYGEYCSELAIRVLGQAGPNVMQQSMSTVVS